MSNTGTTPSRRQASALILALLASAIHAHSPPTNALGEFEPELGFFQSIELVDDSLLFSAQSDFQKIEVHQSKNYGNILVLDDVLQITERDGDSYNEMMTHIPMFQHPSPKRVLVIGGGDGYVLSEVLKHKSVEHVDHVDLDGDVIETCKKFFPWGKAWDDPRAHLHLVDGAKFVRDAADGSYDVIIQDSSDPWMIDETGMAVPLPSGVLYEEVHFEHLNRVLTPGGILNLQAESINVPSSLKGISTWRNTLLKSFAKSRYGTIAVSSYPTGQLGFLMCEKDPSTATVTDEINNRFHTIVNQKEETTYYHPGLQTSCFDLPLWAMKSIYGVNAITFKGPGAAVA